MPFTISPEIPPERRAYKLDGGPVGCLMLHGFMGSPGSARPLGDHLHQHGLTVHAPLLPGHGHLPARLHRVSHRAWLSAAEAALQTLRRTCQDIVLVGHSMGAIAAARLAVAHADIKGIALIAPLYRVPSKAFYVMPLLRHIVPFLQPLKLSAIDDHVVYQRLHDFDPTLDFDDLAVQAWLPEGTRLPTSALDEMRKMVRIGRKTWPTLTVPTLVIQGGKDPASPVANGENVYAAIKHAQKQYAFFPDAGHELMRPFDPAHTDVWRLIHSFLQQHVSF